MFFIWNFTNFFWTIRCYSPHFSIFSGSLVSRNVPINFPPLSGDSLLSDCLFSCYVKLLVYGWFIIHFYQWFRDDRWNQNENWMWTSWNIGPYVPKSHRKLPVSDQGLRGSPRWSFEWCCIPHIMPHSNQQLSIKIWSIFQFLMCFIYKNFWNPKMKDPVNIAGLKIVGSSAHFGQF